MIRRDNPIGWIIISQTDHAALSGEIMKYWGNKKFQSPQPKEEVLFAIREHDNGWADWDKTPKINRKNKYPKNFLEMDYKEQAEIWKRSFMRYSKKHPYASCLIALHFDKFNNNICKTNKNANNLKTEIRDFLYYNLKLNIDEIEGRSDVLTNLKYVQIGDIISLALCHGWKSVKLDDVPTGPEGESIIANIESNDDHNYYIQPFPFNKNCIELSVLGKFVNKKTFTNNRDLTDHINSSTKTQLNFTILNPN
jgi:hypothetical protein